MDNKVKTVYIENFRDAAGGFFHTISYDCGNGLLKAYDFARSTSPEVVDEMKKMAKDISSEILFSEVFGKVVLFDSNTDDVIADSYNPIYHDKDNDTIKGAYIGGSKSTSRIENAHLIDIFNQASSKKGIRVMCDGQDNTFYELFPKNGKTM